MKPFPGLPLVAARYGVKRWRDCLSTTNSPVAASAQDLLQRTVFTVPATTRRWRLLIRNVDDLGNTTLTTPFTFVGLGLGTPVYTLAPNSLWRWSGDATAGMVDSGIPGAQAIPTDGTDYVSPWVTDPTKQFVANTPTLLSMGLTCLNAGTGWSTCQELECMQVKAAGAAAAYLNQVITAMGGFQAPVAARFLLDIRIEMEAVTGMKVLVVPGDSIARGAGTGDALASMSGTLNNENWPGAAGQRGGMLVTNMGCSSALVSSFPAGSHLWTRLDFVNGTTPDLAVVPVGTNSTNNVYTMNVVSLIALIQQLQALGIPRIYMATMIPRGGGYAALGGQVQASAAAGATAIISSLSVANGVQIRIASMPGQILNTNGAPTGAYPNFTLPTPALASAVAPGDWISTGNELNRQQLNDWFRSVPLGCAGCIDFDALMAATPGSNVPAKEVMSTDMLHPLRGGYQRMAALVAPLGGFAR